MAEETQVLSQVPAGPTFAAFPATAIARTVSRGSRVVLPAAAVGLFLAGTLFGTLGIAQVWSAAAWFVSYPLLMASYPDGRLVQRSVAEMLAQGLINRPIAGRLCIGEKTVSNYVSTVLLKLGATDRHEAARRIRESSQ